MTLGQVFSRKNWFFNTVTFEQWDDEPLRFTWEKRVESYIVKFSLHFQIFMYRLKEIKMFSLFTNL